MADDSPHPGVAEETYHTLGKKTLWIFILQRIHTAAVLLLLTIILFVLSGQSFVNASPLGAIGPYVLIAGELFLILFLLASLITFVVGWLIYSHYKFFLGDNSLKIQRGIFTKEEIAIPYRQIQDVDIERDIGFQVMGLSRLVILTAGHEDDKQQDDQSEGILPAMDRKLAEWFQGQLLDRANIQKVTEVPPAQK